MPGSMPGPHTYAVQTGFARLARLSFSGLKPDMLRIYISKTVMLPIPYRVGLLGVIRSDRPEIVLIAMRVRDLTPLALPEFLRSNIS